MATFDCHSTIPSFLQPHTRLIVNDRNGDTGNNATVISKSVTLNSESDQATVPPFPNRIIDSRHLNGARQVIIQ